MADGNIPAPFSRAGNNDYKCLSFTGPTSHATNAIPATWAKKYVVIHPIGTAGDNLHFAFAIDDSDAEVDSGVTATAAGASAKVGGIAPANQDTHRRIPYFKPGETCYFVRESDGSAFTAVIVQLAE